MQVVGANRYVLDTLTESTDDYFRSGFYALTSMGCLQGHSFVLI